MRAFVLSVETEPGKKEKCERLLFEDNTGLLKKVDMSFIPTKKTKVNPECIKSHLFNTLVKDIKYYVHYLFDVTPDVEFVGKNKCCATRGLFSEARDIEGNRIFEYVEEEFCKGKVATKVLFLPKNGKVAKQHMLEKHKRDFLTPRDGTYCGFKSSVKEPSEKDKEIMEEKMVDMNIKKWTKKEMTKVSYACAVTGKGLKSVKHATSKKMVNKGIMKSVKK